MNEGGRDRWGRARQGVGRLWDMLGVGSDLRGRLGFASFLIGLVAGTTVAFVKLLGAVLTILLAISLAFLSVGLWLAITAFVRQLISDQAPTGTLIPPAYAAIITGQQEGEGEWVPPGYVVAMGPGYASDQHGNMAEGPDARIYGGEGNTVLGAGATSGSPPWCKRAQPRPST